MIPNIQIKCAGCQHPLLQETARLEKPFIKYSGTHLDPNWYPEKCPINTTWVYVWKDSEFWKEIERWKKVNN